ncbi:hypothetical protein ACLKA6_003180 [Drosophila palustris]
MYEALISIEELKDFFKSEMAVLSGQFKLVLEKVGQQKIQTAQLLRERSEAEGLSSLNCFAKIMKELLGSSGLKSNLKYILTDELAMEYNVDGILGKESLKSLSFFYKALLDAISKCEVGPPESVLRSAMQLQKKEL